MTGLTARQLQLWDASGLLSSAIPSHRTLVGGYTERRYTPIELFELLALADLRRRGFSIAQLHAIVSILKENFGVRMFEATGGGGAVQLLTDGRELYVRTARRGVFQPAEDAHAAAARGRRRRIVEGIERKNQAASEEARGHRIGKILLEIVGRTRNDVYADKLAGAPGRGGSRVRSRP